MITITDEMICHLDAMEAYHRGLAWLIMSDVYKNKRRIRELPVLRKGQDADLLLEWRSDAPNCPSEYRLWISRMTREDGARHDREVILEQRYTDGRRSWGWRNFGQGDRC